MEETAYAVEEYYAYESGEVVGIYTDLLIAVEKVLKVIEGKGFRREALNYTWTDGDKYYTITEVVVNQDIKAC